MIENLTRVVFPEIAHNPNATRKLPGGTGVHLDSASAFWTNLVGSRKRLDLEISLYTMLQIFSVLPFEKITLKQALTINQKDVEQMYADKQLNLFEF